LWYQHHGPFSTLLNQTAPRGHWLEVRLQGVKGNSRRNRLHDTRAACTSGWEDAGRSCVWRMAERTERRCGSLPGRFIVTLREGSRESSGKPPEVHTLFLVDVPKLRYLIPLLICGLVVRVPTRLQLHERSPGAFRESASGMTAIRGFYLRPNAGPARPPSWHGRRVRPFSALSAPREGDKGSRILRADSGRRPAPLVRVAVLVPFHDGLRTPGPHRYSRTRAPLGAPLAPLFRITSQSQL